MPIHNIDPVYDKKSEILILGSFPSVKSRQIRFFYGHPQNRFWKTMAAVYEDEVPESIEDKKSFLLRHRVAVWDVIESCEIKGSSDSSISNVKVNDVNRIIKNSRITRIFVNGRTAERYYKKYLEKSTGLKAILLESSSPANARYSLTDLIDDWKEKIKGDINNDL